jgi:hypothetical protein
MTKKKILICDDSQEIGNSFKTMIWNVKPLRKFFEEPILASKDQLEKAFDALEQRLKQAIKGEIKEYPINDAAKIIDDASVLVIDYGLFDLNASVTGERIAYLARCYSKCGIIIALNQYPPYVEESFDLTLRGHLESYADINIPSDSLGNTNLWSEQWSGFRPWSWPIIPQAIDKLEQRVEELKEHLDDKIFEFFEFSGSRGLILPRSITEFLSREKTENTTFRNFVDSEGSGNGLRRKEKPINDVAAARIAAARIGSWLEYDVLPSQNILVDAPHLVSRFPSLLGKKSKNIKVLNSTASFLEPNKLGISSVIQPFRFSKTNWVSRPVWFWNDIRDNESIDEVKNPFTTSYIDQVFCEDASKFFAKSEAREFVADLDSPYSRRHVKYLQKIHYTPLVRFSL